MNQPLPRRAPAELNVDSKGVIAFLDGLENSAAVEPHSIMLLRGGSVIAEGWWAPYRPDRVHLLYSLSKSFTSTAAGFAFDEGLLALDATVISYFPELDAEITDARARAILVRHVLAMATGHREDTIERAMATDPADIVRGFLLTPPDEAPGGVFAYNQSATYTVAAIVQRLSGQRLTDYLRPRLFDPLGIGDVSWFEDAAGRQLGFSGMFGPTLAIAHLGQLYLQRGVWNGRRLLSAEWVDLATRSHVSTEREINPDWAQGYGFQFWMARHGYRGDGAFGQFCVILPEHDVVVALTGQSLDMQRVLDLAWEHLLPAFGAEGALVSDEAADAVLRERLSTAQLPPVAAATPLPPLAGSSFSAATGNDHPDLTRVEVNAAPDAARPLELTLLDAGDSLAIAPGVGVWNVAGHLASSAGWIPSGDVAGSGVLAVDIILLETPHRLSLALDVSTSTFTATWATPPLHRRSLRAFRAP